jgi:hypothetical protein
LPFVGNSLSVFDFPRWGRSGGIGKKRGGDRRIALEEEVLKKPNWVGMFGPGGMQQGEIHGQGVGTEIGAIAEDDFAQDHGMTEASFGYPCEGVPERVTYWEDPQTHQVGISTNKQWKVVGVG